MNDRATQVLVERLSQGRGDDERAAIDGMLAYLHRSSLPVLRVEGDVLICGEVDQFQISVDELIALWGDLKNGVPIDWDKLKKA